MIKILMDMIHLILIWFVGDTIIQSFDNVVSNTPDIVVSNVTNPFTSASNGVLNDYLFIIKALWKLILVFLGYRIFKGAWDFITIDPSKRDYQEEKGEDFNTDFDYDVTGLSQPIISSPWFEKKELKEEEFKEEIIVPKISKKKIKDKNTWWSRFKDNGRTKR